MDKNTKAAYDQMYYAARRAKRLEQKRAYRIAHRAEIVAKDRLYRIMRRVRRASLSTIKA